MDSEIIATLIHKNEQVLMDNTQINIKNKELIQENEVLKKENEKIKKRLTDEEEISILLSKRIQIVEEDFRKYVEKMQIYLSYLPHIKNESYNDETINEYNDEIIYEKPHLSRSTNLHEWMNDEIARYNYTCL